MPQNFTRRYTMNRKLVFILPLLLLITSCGPLIGQVMRLSEGIKEVRLIEGDLASLSKGQNLLVVGPFAKTPEAFYIARGDEAAGFQVEFNRREYFNSELYMGNRYGDLQAMFSSLRVTGASQLKDELNLKKSPDLLMFGTVLERETIVAPTRGIIMQVTYRLEFFAPDGGSKTVIEISVRDHFKDCIKTVVGEIIRRAEE